MALIECGECGQSYSDQVKACVHCGAKPAKEKGKGCLPIALKIMAVLVVLSIIISIYNPPAKNNKTDDGQNMFDAVRWCEFIVEKKLKSPESAKFQTIYQGKKGRYLGENVYILQSYVDSQNSFSAMLRTEYTCKVKYIPETNTWKTMKLTL